MNSPDHSVNKMVLIVQKRWMMSSHTDLPLLPVLRGALDAPTTASVILLGEIRGFGMGPPIATAELSGSLRAVAPGAHALEPEIINRMLIIKSLDDK